MPIYLKNVKPIFSGKIRMGSKSLAPTWLSSTVLATPHETQTVNIPLNTNTPSVFALASGTLPPGVTVTGGSLVGTLPTVPAAGGSWSFTLKATDSRTGLSTDKAFQLPVSGSAVGTTWAFPLGQTLHSTYRALTDQPQLLLAADWLSLAARLGTEMVSPLVGRYERFTTSNFSATSTAASPNAGDKFAAVDRNFATMVVGRDVYARSGSSWSLIQNIANTGLSSYGDLNAFGRTVALSGNGLVLAIASNSYSGNFVALFTRTTTSQTFAFKEAIQNNGTSAYFGSSLAFSANAATLIVGASGENGFYHYELNASNTYALKKRYLNIGQLRSGGATVHLSDDAVTLVVRGYNSDNVSSCNALLFTRDASGEYLPRGASIQVSASRGFYLNPQGTKAVTSDGNTRQVLILTRPDATAALGNWTKEILPLPAAAISQGALVFTANDDCSVIALGFNSSGYVFAKVDGVWIQTSTPTFSAGNNVGIMELSRDATKLITNNSYNSVVSFNSSTYLPPAVPHVRLPARADALSVHAMKTHRGANPTWITPEGSLGSFAKAAFTGVQLTADNAGGALAYSITSGALPAGLSLNASTGVIGGSFTGSSDRTASFTVRATGDTPTWYLERAFTLTVTVPAPTATELFAATAYTSSTSKIVTGINVLDHGGLVWMRPRAASNALMFDSARGSSKYLVPSSAEMEGTHGGTSFNSDGFTSTAIGAGQSSVAWSFRKAPKFFDVVTWTGNGVSGRQISHNLSLTPGMIVIKNLNRVQNWKVHHRELNGVGLALNATDAASNTHLAVGGPVDASAFTLHSATNFSGEQYVAYVFAHDTSASGTIQCGSVNGLQTVNLGWQPRFVMMRQHNGTDNWWMLDTTRGIASPGFDAALSANTADTESRGTDFIDLTATGFINKAISAPTIYMAIR